MFMSGRYNPNDRNDPYSSRGYGQNDDYGYDDPPRSSGTRDRSPSRSSSSRSSSSRSSSRRADQGAQASYGQQPYGYGQQPYGSGAGARRPGSPGQPVWGQAAQPTYPGYGGYGRGGVAAPPRARKSRRGLWITLGVVAALLLACGGGAVFAAVQYFAPAAIGSVFCGYVESQGYTLAYAQMSAGAHIQLTSTQFTDAFTTLDNVEGKATACAAAPGSNSYSASLFGTTATVGLVMTRAKAGALQGSVHLKKESAGWRVDAIDSSLLGVNLSAVVASDSYCAALKAQQYADAYTLLGSKLQAATKQPDFVQLAQWHDTVDGQVSACQVTAIAAGTGAGNSTGATSTPTITPTKAPTPGKTATPSKTATPTPSPTPPTTPTTGSATGISDTSATLTLSLARGNAAAQQGALALAVEGGTWKIGDIATALQGSDLSPLQTGGRFCADLAASNYTDAYSLGDAHFYSGMTQTQAAAFLAGTSAASGGLAWSSCTLDASTYAVNNSGTQASYKMTVTFTKKSNGQTVPHAWLFTLVKTAGMWKLHGLLTSP